MRCERGHSITFRDRGPGRIHMANHGKPMKSCRVQFVGRNRGTKDKTLQINSVECKISDTRRIANRFIISQKTSDKSTIFRGFACSSISKRGCYRISKIIYKMCDGNHSGINTGGFEFRFRLHKTDNLLSE